MSIVTSTILSNEEKIDPSYTLLSIEVRKEVNRIPSAHIRVKDGDPTTGTFPLSESPFFEPGKKIEIKLRHEEGGSDATVFKGIVVGQGIEVTGSNIVLTIDLKDAAIKMTQVRKTTVYREKSDDAIIATLVQEANLSEGTLAATTPVHAEIIQYYCTDWDFMLSRADANALLVVVDDGEVALTKMEAATSSVMQFEFGIDEIYDFEMQADAQNQYTAVAASAWDLKNQESLKPLEAEAVTLSQGDLKGEALAEKIGFEDLLLSHPVPLEAEELQAWADARMARSRLSLIRGRIAVPGLSEIKLLDGIDLLGLGTRFNGRATVTGIFHRVDAQGWQTDFQFGLSAKGFSQKEGIPDQAAAGLLPPVSGLQIGVVDVFEEDLKGEFRLKVKLAGLDVEQGSVWARLASPDAGLERGFFFRPEVDDEVIVGFFNDDPRQAVVLGAMYGSKNKPPADFSALDDKNINKGIVTQKGSTIGFVDDEKSQVFIQTPGENKLLLDDDGEAIVLSDQHGNTITMDAAGIEIKSAKDIKLTAASGNVDITGKEVNIN
ncbi:MAG: type VI secretion system tip protein VgrG [Nitrospirota bacterium]|nr:type VI secretion system tip protein VgrG [Nitrospirota bacterium]